MIIEIMFEDCRVCIASLCETIVRMPLFFTPKL
jgi:hypothetical protein